VIQKIFAASDAKNESRNPPHRFVLNEIYGPLEMRGAAAVFPTGVRSVLFNAGVPG